MFLLQSRETYVYLKENILLLSGKTQRAAKLARAVNKKRRDPQESRLLGECRVTEELISLNFRLTHANIIRQTDPQKRFVSPKIIHVNPLRELCEITVYELNSIYQYNHMYHPGNNLAMISQSSSNNPVRFDAKKCYPVCPSIEGNTATSSHCVVLATRCCVS